ncbi:MAG: metal ABC transporter substrate-binding protein [Friedmanniella sp.]
MTGKWRRLSALLTTSALLLVAGCGGAGTATGSSAKQPGQLSIVTAFYPFAFVAERVAGSHALVTTLTQPGAEPHDVELTPRQVGSLSVADLVVYERGFQPAVDQAVDQSGASAVLDTATVVPLEPLGTTPDPHEDGHGHGHEHGHDDGHDDGALDPHIWLDPTNLARIATDLAGRLSAMDGEHAADYRANAARLGRDLGGLDAEFRRGLAHCSRTEFITTHAAFGYLARRYALTQVGITGLNPDTEPSPSRIAQIQREATSRGVTTIFTETLISPAIARSIAGDLGLVTDVLDPVEGITSASRGQDYLAVMRSNLSALEKANGCS